MQPSIIVQVAAAFLRSCRFFDRRLHLYTTIEVFAVLFLNIACTLAVCKLPAGSVVTADHAVKTARGWRRILDTGEFCVRLVVGFLILLERFGFRV